MKYNHSLDIKDSGQNSFESVLQLTKDKKTILVLKKIPNPSMQFVLGVDTEELNRIKMVIRILTLKEKVRPFIGK